MISDGGRTASARPPTTMASAAAIKMAATRKVARMPVVTSSGCADVMSATPDASANTAPMTEAPVRPPRLRDRFSRPDTTPR